MYNELKTVCFTFPFMVDSSSGTHVIHNSQGIVNVRTLFKCLQQGHNVLLKWCIGDTGIYHMFSFTSKFVDDNDVEHYVFSCHTRNDTASLVRRKNIVFNLELDDPTLTIYSTQ